MKFEPYPLVKQIKQKQPLILNLTNPVSMDFVANGLSCLGASPIMSEALEELDDLIKIASCIVINLGTLNADFLKRAHHACKLANQAQKPIILDPVGAGATHYRTQSAMDILSTYRIEIIRGNASEVAALAGQAKTTKGIDSSIRTHEALDAAQTLAHIYKLTLCISGETDVIINSEQVEPFHRGSALMPKVVGTGCLLSAVVAAFHAVEPNAFHAAGSAALFYAQCGEQAAQKANAPGEFKVHFLDALYQGSF